jgi:type II secretory pathway pseudopilin PulG
MIRRRNISYGFTLLEVVLAVGLAGVVLALLTTAINLYLVRVDINRTRVESAQLARTLLANMADDIRAARYGSAPSDSSSSSSDSDSGSDSGGAEEDDTQGGGSSDTGLATATDSETSSQIYGIFGTATELRIDRTARWRWERTTQPIDATSETLAQDMPQTVNYIFNSGDTLLAGRLASLGVLSEPATSGYAGLYRQQSATSSWVYQSSSTGVSRSGSEESAPELIAPEVLALEFRYFDGEQMLDSWDSAAQGELPRGVEIRLTLLKEPFELAMIQSPQEREAELRRAENAVEYRSFVRLPNVRLRRADGPRRRSGRQSSGQQSGSSGGSRDESSSE